MKKTNRLSKYVIFFLVSVLSLAIIDDMDVAAKDYKYVYVVSKVIEKRPSGRYGDDTIQTSKYKLSYTQDGMIEGDGRFDLEYDSQNRIIKWNAPRLNLALTYNKKGRITKCKGDAILAFGVQEKVAHKPKYNSSGRVEEYKTSLIYRQTFDEEGNIKTTSPDGINEYTEYIYDSQKYIVQSRVYMNNAVVSDMSYENIQKDGNVVQRIEKHTVPNGVPYYLSTTYKYKKIMVPKENVKAVKLQQKYYINWGDDFSHAIFN